MPPIASEPFAYRGKSYLGKIYRPYLHIFFYSKARKAWQPVEVLVDTGADYTLLPQRYADILGINILVDCHPETTIGVGGNENVYQYKKLPVRISRWEKMIPVGFLRRDDIPPVLGRLNCLETLKLIMTNFRTILEKD